MNNLLSREYAPVIQTEIMDNNYLFWKVVLAGIKDTKKEWIFTLNFIFQDNYQTGSPEARFTIKMFHPNIRDRDQIYALIF